MGRASAATLAPGAAAPAPGGAALAPGGAALAPGGAALAPDAAALAPDAGALGPGASTALPAFTRARIARACREALERSGALGVLPTPLEAVGAAVGVRERIALADDVPAPPEL